MLGVKPEWMSIFTIFAALAANPVFAFVLDGAIEQQTGTGSFVKLDTDSSFSVGYDTFDDDNLYAFDEDQNIVLDQRIRVDIGGDEGFIAEGTVVASHYVFFDSLSGVHVGYVYFDAPILGYRSFA